MERLRLMQRLRFGLTSNDFRLRNQEAAAPGASKTCKRDSGRYVFLNRRVFYTPISFSDARLLDCSRENAVTVLAGLNGISLFFSKLCVAKMGKV